MCSSDLEDSSLCKGDTNTEYIFYVNHETLTDLVYWNCFVYFIGFFMSYIKESLGRAMGKEFRASLAVQDENFAKAIMKALEKESGR